jgi:hypothetical protein
MCLNGLTLAFLMPVAKKRPNGLLTKESNGRIIAATTIENGGGSALAVAVRSVHRRKEAAPWISPAASS